MNKNEKILIVGLGLIGGSYAIGLSKKGYLVSAIDINQDAIEYAKNEGFIINDKKSKELIKESTLIILCLYPKDNVKWIKENAKYINKTAIITDVSGVKVAIIDEINSYLPNNEFIASHPMAGKEASGVKNATSEIFKGANFLITPTKDNTDYAINKIKKLAEELEFSNIEVITPEFHDEMIGFLSQLTHVVAISLMNSHEVENMIRYTGDSFRDLTRIAKINENLWSELFLLNKDVLTRNIDEFIVEISKVNEMIKNNQIEELKESMKSSTIRRQLFDKK